MKATKDSKKSKRKKEKDIEIKVTKVGRGRFMVLCGIIIIIVFGSLFIREIVNRNEVTELYDEIEEDYTVKASSSDEAAEVVWYQLISCNFTGLANFNPDIVGWIYFEDGEISYPIVHSASNETYLRTAPSGEHATAGSIILEAENNTDFSDPYIIIYGHNMRNLSMFGKLKYYKDTEGYYEDGHQYFQIVTPTGVYRYLIFAYENVESTDEVIYSVISGANTSAMDTLIEQIQSESMLDADVPVSSSNQIVTLSTCTSAGEEKRFVVHGVLTETYFYQ